MKVVYLVQFWQWNGMAVVLYLAGLQNVPEDLRHAALIDGANRWRVFRDVTFPMLAPAFTIVTVLSFILIFRAFDLIYVLGGSVARPTAHAGARRADLRRRLRHQQLQIIDALELRDGGGRDALRLPGGHVRVVDEIARPARRSDSGTEPTLRTIEGRTVATIYNPSVYRPKSRRQKLRARS